MSFNKWKDEYGLEFEPNYSKETELDCKAAFKAGQQSRKAEIDNLQKRIEDIITSIDWHIEDCELWLSMNKNDSWKGGQLEILKAIRYIDRVSK
mgnify:CR=1 FL=1